MGVSAPTVSRMEANITRASLDTLTRYALACGIKSTRKFYFTNALGGYSVLTGAN